MTTKEKLQAELDERGIEYHHANGEVKLQSLLDAANSLIEPNPEPEQEEIEETKIQRHARLRKEQKALIRVIVRCNNEHKKEWTGEVFKVSNSLHTFTRFVPFDNEDGWHVEQSILNTMEEKMCQRFREEKLPNGMKTRVGFMVKEYVISKMKPLTQKELDKLATEQAARGSIDS